MEGAMRGYKDINLRALRLLGPGGILVTCSCSHHMSEAMLIEVVAEASLDAGKTLRVLERRMQAADHPVLVTVVLGIWQPERAVAQTAAHGPERCRFERSKRSLAIAALDERVPRVSHGGGSPARVTRK